MGKKGLFLQRGVSGFLGSMYISAALKKANHKCDLLIISKERNLLSKIKKIKPDFILVNLMSCDFQLILKLLKVIKKNMRVTTIVGGIHPTIYPEIIKEPSIDIICIGEGEKGIVDIFNGKDLSKISNISFKRNGKVIKNEMGCLVNLDELPFPDRDLYKRYPIIMKSVTFMASRGCPFQCNYCFNHQLQKLYHGKGKYVRMKSPENLIREIEKTREKISIKKILFADDALNKNRGWFREFSELYKKRVNLPYTCNIRIDLVDEGIAKLLKESSCYGVRLGIETGNEELRKKVLNRPMKNSSIIRGAKILNKYKIPFQTNTMLGLPDETIKNSFETVDLNIKIKPSCVFCSLLIPYPRTGIYEYAMKKNYIKKGDINKFSLTKSYLQIKDINQINNLHKFFYIVVKFPFLKPIIKILIKLPPNIFYLMIYYMADTFRYYKIYKPPIFHLFKRCKDYILYLTNRPIITNPNNE